jgi:hypothetical protein
MADEVVSKSPNDIDGGLVTASPLAAPLGPPPMSKKAGAILVGKQYAWPKLLSKEEVHFESPAEGEDDCDDCEHFILGGRCELVAGVIGPEDWCDRFKEVDDDDDDDDDDDEQTFLELIYKLIGQWCRRKKEVY